MDKAINEFLDNLINKCLLSPYFSALSDDEKAKLKEKIQNHFSNIVIDNLIDHLNEEQLKQIEHLDPNSKEMEEKIQLFAAGIPNLAFRLEEKLNDEATRISQTGHIPA